MRQASRGVVYCPPTPAQSPPSWLSRPSEAVVTVSSRTVLLRGSPQRLAFAVDGGHSNDAAPLARKLTPASPALTVHKVQIKVAKGSCKGVRILTQFATCWLSARVCSTQLAAWAAPANSPGPISGLFAPWPIGVIPGRTLAWSLTCTKQISFRGLSKLDQGAACGVQLRSGCATVAEP